MLPNPLHPAIVHFPVVLAFLLPVTIVVALWAIGRELGSSRVGRSVRDRGRARGKRLGGRRDGEAQDERVERVVAEAPLSAHEEWPRLFWPAPLVLS